MQIIKHIPNTITSMNLLAGTLGVIFTLDGRIDIAFPLMLAAAGFDFCDGFAARLLNAYSNIGKELDSLADDITFGFAPSAVIFSMLRSLSTPQVPLFNSPLVAEVLPYVAFVMAAFSALRLAKFNLDERQTTSFIGMPTPANALFWTSLSVTIQFNTEHIPANAYAIMLIAGTFIASWLLVAEIPMFALKFKSYGLKDNELRYGFILVSILLLILLGITAFSAIIILYVLTSVALDFFTNQLK